MTTASAKPEAAQRGRKIPASLPHRSNQPELPIFWAWKRLRYCWFLG